MSSDNRWFEPRRLSEHIVIDDTPVHRCYQEVWDALTWVGQLDFDDPRFDGAIEEGREAIAALVEAILSERPQ